MKEPSMVISNDFSIGNIVYFRHDIDQLPRMIVGISISKDNILYELISGVVVSNHYDFEISLEKVVF